MGGMAKSPKPSDISKAAESLRQVAAHTSGLPEDSATDAQLRDRLELAADVLDAVAEAQE
jgi:CubicO group peptidase (beta-lactamase class C family)